MSQEPVGQAADELMAKDPSMCLQAVLLRALWNNESAFSPSDVGRFQIMVADTLLDTAAEPTEAAWWFAGPPDDMEFLGFP